MLHRSLGMTVRTWPRRETQLNLLFVIVFLRRGGEVFLCWCPLPAPAIVFLLGGIECVIHFLCALSSEEGFQ